MLYKITCYIPVANVNDVKIALFDAGAGRIGNYDRCSWETLGRGQFRPLPGSAPVIGNIDEITYVDEIKLEMVCDGEFIQKAITALLNAHPYETPAYEVYLIMDRSNLQ